MRDAGRIAAAIEVLDAIHTHHQPSKEALRDWGKTHRFAGSGDRAWISGLVLDALRFRASSAYRFGEDTPRSWVLGALSRDWGYDAAKLAGVFEGDEHAPDALSEAEATAMDTPLAADAPLYARADIPEWLAASFEETYGQDAAREGQGMTTRAPVDLRVNQAKVEPEKALHAVRQKLNADPSALIKGALRIVPKDATAKAAPADAIPAYGKGWVEVQDLGSQIVTLAAGACQGKQVLDYCAGAGGKTLALASLMGEGGQIYAWDLDWRRLRAIWPRIKRADVRNAQVRDGKEAEALSDLVEKMDVVFVDAPCSGSGTWRRRPDTKWKLTERAIERRKEQQGEVLAGASRYVKPGGRMVYVTCSVLAQENEAAIEGFLAQHSDTFKPVPAMAAIRETGQLTEQGDLDIGACEGRFGALQLTPARTGTDGFYVCVLERV